jgi:diacylglycerol kinase (ATP)
MRLSAAPTKPKLHQAKSRPILSKHQISRALTVSLAGLANAWRTERAFRLEATVLAAAVPVAFLLTPDFFRRAELIACLLAVLAVELLNTSIEKLCDRTTPQIDPVIKIVKDMGSAAVFCALCMAGALWIGAALSRFA